MAVQHVTVAGNTYAAPGDAPAILRRHLGHHGIRQVAAA